MPKKIIPTEPEISDHDEEEGEEGEKVIPVLTKKGQRPRQITEEHKNKLALAREKAKEAQARNKELRLMEKENKAHEELLRKQAIRDKNNEIRKSLKKMPNKDASKPSILTKTTPEPVEEPEEEEEENVKVVKKEKKKKSKKPIVIVEESDSDSDDDHQVVYIKRNRKKVAPPAPAPAPAPPPEPVYEPPPEPPQPRFAMNPFHNVQFKRY